MGDDGGHGATNGAGDDLIEIDDGDTVWSFERAFLESNWSCVFGSGCQGILPEAAPQLGQGCCSFGAHLGDGDDGRAEALDLAAYASLLTPGQWQLHSELEQQGPAAIFADETRTHTRVVDGACVFLNRPGFAGGSGCALHIAAEAAGESVVDWKPSVCWQLPIRVDWEPIDDERERATVRRWRRDDWGEFGETMAWCCTEPAERTPTADAYVGQGRVVDDLSAELDEIAGHAVVVELRRRLG